MPEIRNLTDRQLALFCRGLSLQLRAGISLTDGIYLLAQDMTGEDSKDLERMARLMDEGAKLSEALEEAGNFPPYLRGMVRIGEQTGKLEQTLHALAEFYDRRSQQRRQIKNAISYPAMVFTLMLLVVGVLLVKVMPVFDGVYASLGSRLTGVAAGLLYLGQLLQRGLPAILGALAAVLLVALLYAKQAPFRKWVNFRYQIRFGDRGISRKYNNARFAGALAMGLSSGLSIEEAMELAEQLLHDIPGAAKRCRICITAMEQRETLSEAMAHAELLPPSESRMLAVGLRAGNGDRVMEEIALRLQQQAEQALEDTVAKIEPAMVLAASLLVGVILLSVMLPLMNIMSAIG